MENDILYINIHDNQGTGWALGRLGTLKDWREQAMDWADSDGNEETYDALRDMDDTELPDYISDIWDIQIKSIHTLTAEEFDGIKESIHLF